MSRCSDRRKLSELDPVTFFIVTELMRAQDEQPKPPERAMKAAPPTVEDTLTQVA